MKKSILLIILSVFAATGQSIPLYNDVNTLSNYGDVPGAYYEDIGNDLNPFTGTWEYVNGTTSFRIVLEKRVYSYNSMNNFYEDMLIGEYRYVESGIERVNTLNILNAPPVNLYKHSIVGHGILGNQYRPVCNDCAVNEKRVSLLFSDINRDYRTNLSGEIILRRMDIGTVQKIQFSLISTGNVISIEGQPAPPNSFNVPWGTYILTKVN